jgi:hypothetical protein
MLNLLAASAIVDFRPGASTCPASMRKLHFPRSQNDSLVQGPTIEAVCFSKQNPQRDGILRILHSVPPSCRSLSQLGIFLQRFEMGLEPNLRD